MTKKETAEALLERHGRTFSDELGIDLAANTPSPLFMWLISCVLFSAPIRWTNAMEAAGALFETGWRTPEKMADTTWQERVDVITWRGYKRYDEKTATTLDEVTRRLLDRYRGDLRRLRDEAERDPKAERRLLKEFKGLGDTGVDIFFREAQLAWDELWPFADDLALKAAKRFELGDDAEALADLVGREKFVPLLASLTRAQLDDESPEDLG